MEVSNLALFWAGVLGCAVLLYVILDGLDLGVGIQDHVKQDRAAQNASPKQCQVAHFHDAYLPVWGPLPVAVSSVSAYASGRLPVAPSDGRSLLQKLVDVVDPKGDKGGVNENVAGERDQDVAGCERRRHRVFGAQQAVDDPRLASHLGDIPPG